MGAVRSLGRTPTTVDTISWTAVVAPLNGNRVVLTPRSTGWSVKFRTNDGDSTTEFTLAAGVQKTYDIPAGDRWGFVSGETVIYAQAVSSATTVDADWS